MAQPSLLRTAVPDQSARRLFCPAVFTYTRLTRWPHSYRQLSRDRRVMTRSIMRINHMLKSMGSLEQQKSYVVRTRKGERVHIFETPRGASADGPGDKYTLRDTWRLRLLLLKQLNAIVRAATENSEAPEPEAPTSPSFSAEGDLQEGAAAAAANSSPGSSFSSEAQQQGDSSHTIAYSNPSPTDRYIFYLHGGAFISQSPDFYRILLNELSRQTGARVIAPYYSLAPESLFPTQLLQIFSVYKSLVTEEGISPSRMVVVGDSAGGNLVVTLLMQIAKHNQSLEDSETPLEMPKAVVMLSPWLDLSQSGPSYTLNKTAEPLLPLLSIRKAAFLYRFGRSGFTLEQQEESQDKSPFRDPWVSPVYLSDPEILKTFPPMAIHAGSVEVLLSDSLVFARRANAAAGDGEFEDRVPLHSLSIAEHCGSSELSSSNSTSSSGSSSSSSANEKIPSEHSTSPSPEIDLRGNLSLPHSAVAAVRTAAQETTAAAADEAEDRESSMGTPEESEDASAAAEAAADTAARLESLEKDEPDSPLADFAAVAPSDILAFMTAESSRSEENDGTANPDPLLPSFFNSLGWLSDDNLQTLAEKGTVDATEGQGAQNPKVCVTVWKDEFHVFPCFGFMEEPSASECTKQIADWINLQFGETPEESAAAIAAATIAAAAAPAEGAAAPATAAEVK